MIRPRILGTKDPRRNFSLRDEYSVRGITVQGKFFAEYVGYGTRRKHHFTFIKNFATSLLPFPTRLLSLIPKIEEKLAVVKNFCNYVQFFADRSKFEIFSIALATPF